MPNMSYNFAGAGAVVADSLVVSGTAQLDGAVDINAAVSVDGNLTMESGRKLKIDNANTPTDCPLQVRGDPNTGISVPSADAMNFIANGGAPLGVVNGGASSTTLTVTSNLVNQGALYQKEMAAPAGLTDYAIIHATVDGGSKTDLNVIFQTGAAIKITEEV